MTTNIEQKFFEVFGMNPIAVAEYNGNFSLDVNGNVYRVTKPVEIYNIDNLSQTAYNIKYLPE